ncbi:MAG: monovalent cation/H+ antiporter complex subunit F [Xanthobacteraceae bacterium]|nr:monovalent cation/H+ antiporter complex subunit F [Xanthobacteraceae bacterium]PWB66039.1 MAG: multiple resistance and pH regulation protein F [Bradyrhizobiaceae bacterium]
MADALHLFAGAILLAVAASLVRVVLGPTRADRMMGAQLAGTGGIAVVLLLSVAGERWAALDVALTLSLLAAVAAVGFVKAASRDGAGDPEEEAPPP